MTKSSHTLNVRRDFSRTPGPRYRHEGNFSGEQFREEVLLPAVRKAINEKYQVVVVLDGAAGYGTSFLEESFGGLIRICRLKYQDVINAIRFKSFEEPDLVAEIKEYLLDAKEA